MLKFTNKQIAEFADSIDSGLICYIHKTTFKIDILLDRDSSEHFGYAGEEDEFYEDIDKNFLDYVTIEKLDTHQAFKLMEHFAVQITNSKIRNRFFNALERQGPFRNFRHELYDHPDIQKDWYVFKKNELIEHVRKELKYFFPDAILEKEIEVIEEKPKFNFNSKVFSLTANSDNGEVSSETTFEFSQNGDLVTADYFGGTILCGKIIAILKGDQLHMSYQSVTKDHKFDSGKAIADIEYNENGKIKLSLQWEWLEESGETGVSEYIEQ